MPVPRLSPFAALRHRNFRLFYAGQTTSLVGTWMQGLAQGWLVLELTDSAFWVGLVSFFTALPVLLFSLPAGVFVDRADKRRLVMLCQGAMLGVAAALTVLTATGVIEAWHIALLAFVQGSLNAVEIPARQSMIVELVGKDDLTNAIALNSSAFNATRIVGPAVAGVVVANAGVTACFALNMLTYLAPLIALRRMRRPPWVRPEAAGEVAAQLREGLRFVRAERPVFALILATSLLSVLGFPYVVLMPVFARDVFAVGADGLGVMTGAIGVGALAAALGLAAFSARAPRGLLVGWASTMFGLAVAAFAYAPRFPLAVLLLALSGFTMVLNNAATNTLLQGLVPDALRGRVMALWSLVFVGFSPIGAMAVGALAARLGPSGAVALGGAASSLCMLFIWRRVAPGVLRLR